MNLTQLIKLGEMIRRSSELTHLHKTAQRDTLLRTLLGAGIGGATGYGVGNLAGHEGLGALGGAMLGAAGGYGNFNLGPTPGSWASTNRFLRSNTAQNFIPLAGAAAGGLAGGVVGNQAGDNTMLGIGVGSGLGAALAGGGRNWLLNQSRAAMRTHAGDPANMDAALDYFRRNARGRGGVFEDLLLNDKNNLAARQTILNSVDQMDNRTSDAIADALAQGRPVSMTDAAGNVVNRNIDQVASEYARNMFLDPSNLTNNAQLHNFALPSAMSAPARFLYNNLGPGYMQNYIHPALLAGGTYMGARAIGDVYNTFTGGNQNNGNGRRVVIV